MRASHWLKPRKISRRGTVATVSQGGGHVFTTAPFGGEVQWKVAEISAFSDVELTRRVDALSLNKSTLLLVSQVRVF